MKRTAIFFVIWGVMTTSVLTELIDVDINPIQLVIDKVSEILVNEAKNQQALAIAAGFDHLSYDFRVFADRFDPLDSVKKDKRAIVSIKESDNSKKLSVSGNHGKQQKLLTLNIDCFGIGSAEQTIEGHRPADMDASHNARRLSNLVNHILKSEINFNLQLDPKIVNSVNIVSEQYLEPDFDSRMLGPIVVKRLTLQCNVTDFPKINKGVEFEGVIVDIERGDSGEIYAKIEQNY